VGYGGSRRLGKFYWEQIGEIQSLFKKKIKDENSNFDLDKYLLLCEQLGEEPDPTKMPLELSDLPEEVQVAFFMWALLPDHWEGMSGTYMGKYWDGIEYYFKLYGIEEPKVVLYIMKMYEGELVSHRAEEAEKKRQAEERKAKAASGGGKRFTHNVKG
jgi:hypothetical protein